MLLNYKNINLKTFLKYESINTNESENLKTTTKKLLKEINEKDKYKNNPKNINMDFNEFISYSENMEYLSKFLNLKFLDEKQLEKLKMNIDVPKIRSFIENDIFIYGENNKKYLLVHDIRNLQLQEIVNSDIEFDEIAIASKHILSALLGDKSQTVKTIDENVGADEYMSEVINIAKIKKATEIYASLRNFELNIRIRNHEGINPISIKGIKEAEILRKWFEIKTNSREGAIFYDGMFRIVHDDFRVNFQETYAGYRITTRVYLNEFKSLNSLEEAGYSKNAERIIRDISLSQDGGLIFSAPTGQGKTTTQNILLTILANKGYEIISVENPVEKFISKIDQVDMTKYTDAEGIHKVTKANFINNAMRSKADVIGLGEIREEDFNDAKKVALTGHFFMGSTHTTSVLGTIQRFKEQGWSDLDIKTLLRGVVYQQLTRQLCTNCKVVDENSYKSNEIELGKTTYYKANYEGCQNCLHGYKKIFTPIAEIAQFPIFKDFDLYDVKTYQNYISFIEDAKTKFEDGVIDYIHFKALEKKERVPFFVDFIPKEFLDKDIYDEDE